MTNSREYQRAKARQEGYIAAKQGKPDTANPYIECDEWNHDGAYHFAWDRGWNEGAEEYNKPKLGAKLQWNKGDNMEFDEPKVGNPVYVKNYRCSDGTMWSGWGILMDTNTNLDHQFKVLAPVGNRPTTIFSTSVYLEPPRIETVWRHIEDDDGNTIKLSYGEYDDPEKGQVFIFGIDTPEETVSFCVKDLKPLAEAIRKLYNASGE